MAEESGRERLKPESSEPDRDSEPPIFSGPVSLWMGFGTFFFAGILIIGGIALAFMGGPFAIGGLALAAASAIMVLYSIIRIKTQRYTITRKLIEREMGVFMKRVDALDLARAKDVEFSQSLIQRMLNIGTIEVYSTDKTDPEMTIEDIPDPRPIYQRLRDAVIEINRKRGVIID